MGILDDIGGAAGDVLSGIGQVAKPLSPLLGFAGVPTGPTGSQGGLSLSNLFGGLKQGLGMASLANPLGLVDMAKHAWDDQLTPLEKGLSIGGLLLGAGALGRHEYRKWSGSQEVLGQFPEHVASALPVDFGANESALASVGLPPRVRRPEFDPMDHGLNRYVPGISQRSARVLASRDSAGTAEALGRWDRTDPNAGVHQARLATLVDGLARRLAPEGVEGGLDPQGLRGAQLDLAKAAAALDSHIFSGQSKRTEQFRKTLTRALKDPASLKDNDLQALTDDLATWGSATQRIGDPDLQFDPLAKMVGASFTDDGQMVFQMYRPPWHGEVLGVGKERVRHERLRQLNYRPLYDAGVDHVRYLLDKGQSGDIPLELGPKWYTAGQQESYVQHDALLGRLEQQYGSEGWRPTQDQALAAVSLTSAAENWRTNISKAMDVLEVVARPEVGKPSFQNWLRSGQGETRGNSGTFREIHAELNERGMKFDEYSLKKLLRFRSESPETVFQSTGGPAGRAGMKQKNFYLNLKDPSLNVPVTIDRHAYDAFLGLDTGIANRPIDATVGAKGENVYQMISEAYRQVAEEKGMKPNEVQAVVWETWKALKAEHGRNSWARSDPFRLQLKGENPAFLAMQGQGAVTTQELMSLAGTGRVPTLFGPRRANGALELRTTPDGSVAVLGDPSGATHDAVRHLYPTVADAEHGVVRWIPGVVRRVRDLRPVIDDFNHPLPSGDSPGHVLESYDNTSLVTHPAIVPGHHLLATVPDEHVGGFKQATAGQTVRELQGSTIDKPTYSRAKLGLGDLNPDTLGDPRTSQLTSSPWVGISAPPERLAELSRDMRRKGYSPIPVDGNYFGEQEASFIAIGMSPEEGVKLGKKYGQESIVTPDGLFYSDGRTMPSTGGITFDQNATENYSTITMPDGKQVKFSVDIPGHFEEIPGRTLYDARGPKPGRRFHVEMPAKATTEDLAAMARNLKAVGATDIVGYGHTNDLGSEFTPTRDHIYTDGNRTVVHRSLDKDITSPHGYRSFVPNEDAIGLPVGKHSLNARALRDRNLTHDELSGLSFINNEVAVASDHLPGVNLKADVFRTSYQGAKTNFFSVSTAPGEMPVVTLGRNAVEAQGQMGLGGIAGHVDRRGRPVLEMPAGASDMAPVYQAADTLRRMGYDPDQILISVADGAGDVIHRLQPIKDTTQLQETVFSGGMDPVTQPRQVRQSHGADSAELDMALEDKLGVGGGAVNLAMIHPVAAERVRTMLAAAHKKFPGLFQKYNPRQITSRPAAELHAGMSTLAEMAFTGKGHKGMPELILNEEWFGMNPDRFEEAVKPWHDSGHFTKTNLKPIEQHIAHEISHMVHATAHFDNVQTGIKFGDWMSKRFGFLGGESAPEGSDIYQVSKYAGQNWQEAVAESLTSYHYSSTHNPVAEELVRAFDGFFSTKLAWGRPTGTVPSVTKGIA